MTAFDFLSYLSTIPNKCSLLYYKDVVITGIYVGKWKIILSTAKHTKKCTTIRHIADTLIRFNNRQQISIVLNYKFRYYSLNTITFKNNYVELF